MTVRFYHCCDYPYFSVPRNSSRFCSLQCDPNYEPGYDWDGPAFLLSTNQRCCELECNLKYLKVINEGPMFSGINKDAIKAAFFVVVRKI